ncbi:site-specific integrase [Citrobacter portucalensis]|uniref:site-specific integrase n=1 Tax=Citrobacter portucalensis TaxID=1639133 RepID=UPI00226B0A41|nr:site-specific integrase [Citrobacter portucalensis]MCX9067292.1 site-specific integrase [Citrobacter portucalensis]
MSIQTRFRFTNALIKNLPPNATDTRSTDAEYSDTEISGLKCLVGRGEGRKKFLLRYLYHGRKRAIALGHWPEVDVSLARHLALECKRQLAMGADPKQQRDSKRQEITLNELFTRHYLRWAISNKRSWKKDEQRYRDHIRPAMGMMLLSDITPSSILRLQQKLTTPLSPATCNRIIVLIKAMFTWAGRQGLTTEHPARIVSLLRENNARQRYFSEEEIRRIFIAADDDSNPVAARYVKLLLLTGLRKDELRLAKWEHLDAIKRTLWLPETKNGYGRIVHLNTLAMEVIRTLPTQKGNPWLFIGRKEKMPLNNPTKAFRRIMFRAGIFDKEVCIHTCRHSVAALIVSHGGTLYDVQAQLGHRSSQSSQRYAHLHPQRLRNTSQLLAERIGAQLPSLI